MTVKQNIKSLAPASLLSLWQRASQNRRILRNLRSIGDRICAACGYHGALLPDGQPPRFDSRCPHCGAAERHRLFFLALKRGWLSEQDFQLQEPILHFAAESVLEKYFRAHFVNYDTADLHTPADLRLNIERMELPADRYATIIANHVLEHVDDSAAAKEIWRVLRPKGIFVAMVPIIEGWDTTYENPSISSDEERLLHYGQADHVRYYGRDFRDRICRHGLTLVAELTAEGADVPRYALMRGEKIFVFQKN